MPANLSHKNQLFPLYPQSTQMKQRKALAQPAPAQFLNQSRGAVLCFEPARSDRASKVSRCSHVGLQQEKGEHMGCFTGPQV